MLAMDYKGDIYPCLRYMESSLGNKVPPFTIGNLEDGINCKKEHCDRVNCLSCITRRSQSTDKCFNCPISSGCAWCSAYNYEVFGTPNKRATFICCMHKARTLANFYYWRKRGIAYPMNCPEEWAIEIIGEEEFKKLIELGVT
jgi:radical SAM protein with 4Fe4S-binding SPASM domain